MADKIELNLWDELILSEIRSKNDTFRHLLSVSVLLIGAYTTILLNSILNVVLNIRTEKSSMFYLTDSNLTNFSNSANAVFPGSSYYIVPLFIIILLLSPIVFWVRSIILITHRFIDTDVRSNLVNPDEYEKTLSDIHFWINITLEDVCKNILTGLVLVVAIIMLFLLVILVFS